MSNEIKQSIADAIAAASELCPADILPLIESPKNPEFGDLAFPCFILAKKWKTSPPQCCEKLASEMALPDGISELNAVGPFLNFRFDKGHLASRVFKSIFREEEKPFVDKTVVVEYSSPNIAKPFHVGHLRTTLIGNSLDRVHRRCGWKTISINHLGDWGTQFGFVWAGCEIWGKPEEKTVSALVELYRKATSLKDTQEKDALSAEAKKHPDINEMARGYFRDLESGEGYALDFWKMCVEISMDYLKASYERLGVSFDHYTGESFYSDKLEQVEKDLRAANILVESEGAFGVDLGEKLGFARTATADGRSLYLTRDLATAKYRAETFHFDKAVYVVGSPQTLHFQQIRAILSAMGADYAEKIQHVAFGHVLGMKTRGEGGAIELNEFLDEAYNRALEAYRTEVSKRPEGLEEEKVAEAVALSAIIFSNLSRSNIKDVHFSWEHALAFQGDSGPYLLYAYARIQGIKQRAKENGIEVNTKADSSLLTEDTAAAVLSTLSEFDNVLQRVVNDGEPYYLAAYALSLAKAVSKAYLDLKVIGVETELAEARLALFEASGIRLAETLRLLGITPIERM